MAWPFDAVLSVLRRIGSIGGLGGGKKDSTKALLLHAKVSSLRNPQQVIILLKDTATVCQALKVWAWVSGWLLPAWV